MLSAACDQCRRTKTKCIRNDNDHETCANCASFRISCTYLDPSYKRGPPKGYLTAVEKRLQQVESVLGTIVGSPDARAQGVVNDLRSDELAREIINRVDRGPFGPNGRNARQSGLTRESFLNAVYNESSQNSRTNRQSRAAREYVSSHQDALCEPTPEWQERLGQQLERNDSGHAIRRSISHAPQSAQPSGGHHGHDDRRPNKMLKTFDHRSISTGTLTSHAESKTSDDSSSDEDGFFNRMGSLSLDENNQIRYHSDASALPLLNLFSDGGARMPPMSRRWSPEEDNAARRPIDDFDNEQMPSPEKQDFLLDLYFTYVHPVLPVIHKASFLSDYNAIVNGHVHAHPPLLAERRRNVKMLSLAMFTIACRYYDNELPLPSPGSMWEAGCEYLGCLKRMLGATYFQSCISTCQVLLILAYREGGIGSTEQGWLFLGMSLRPLGLHRAADGWQQNGRDLFTPAQKQERKQVWCACSIVDKCVLSADVPRDWTMFYLIVPGICPYFLVRSSRRPVAIREREFDTGLPSEDERDEVEQWQPHRSVSQRARYGPVVSHTLSCFNAATTLSIIQGCIVDQIYPVRKTPNARQMKDLSGLETRLGQWYRNLPKHLHYDVSNNSPVPPPHILTLHVQYWCSVLLLHRRFAERPGSQPAPQSPRNTESSKAFDLCRHAATKITDIVTVYSATFCLRRCPAFLSAYLFSAGVMHIATLSSNPSDAQSSRGLQQALSSMRAMEVVWPSAVRVRELLSGAKLRVEIPKQILRPADQCRRESETGLHKPQSSPSCVIAKPRPHAPIVSYTPSAAERDMSTRLMAHMLGLDIPYIEPSTCYHYYGVRA
ncbi:hypothetical protein BD410DRAFT_730171 [Rickenella mellea]|uniref:Zn(2)-C6 fungal-type domain-containing protein n=1 Tax=Rickenella mellea TaxID=50990 RepID=A0A4Y7PRZ0_9AGAM|nr:hypothetical protein BD410DRAFT_730171 [Rickenella mellea]